MKVILMQDVKGQGKKGTQALIAALATFSGKDWQPIDS